MTNTLQHSVSQSGIWTVFKAGKLRICICEYTADNAYVDKTWGDLYYSNNLSLPDFPFAFSEIPHVHVSYNGADANTNHDVITVAHSIGSITTTSCGLVYLLRPSDVFVTVGHPRLNILAIGMVNQHSVSRYKILWSGTSYMASSHTVSLSENISSQNFGIVLAWSGYGSSKGVAYDYDWNYTFISKYHTLNSLSQNKGVGCLLTDASGDIIARKYIYVHDNYLQGYSNNDAQSVITAFSQIKFQNAYFVLRYVIGV